MQNQNTTILILGCGGFIGSHILPRLLDETGHRVVGIDVNASKIEEFLAHPRFTFEQLDVHDTAAVRKHVEKSDVVMSLVALCNPALYNTIPLSVIDINFTRPMELVQMCAEMNKWLIHFSTSEIYGKTISGVAGGTYDNPDRYVLKEDESPLILGPITAQRWSYASAKQLLERLIYAYGYEQDLAWTVIRPFNFIGPRMDFIPGVDGTGTPRVLACFMEALLEAKPLKLVDGGANRRNFTFVEDAVDAVMGVLNNPSEARGQAFNIGDPRNEVSVAELARMMIDIYRELRPEARDWELRTVSVSAQEFYGTGYDDSDRRVPDITKAQQLLKWAPQTPLRDALKTTIAYYIEHYASLTEGLSEQSTSDSGGD